MRNQAYLQLGQQIDQLNQQQSQLTANQQILSSSFGITKNQAMEVAQALGVNLNQALDPSQVKAFGQYVTEMGLASSTTGTQISSMSGTVITALSSLESQTKTIFDPAAFAALVRTSTRASLKGSTGPNRSSLLPRRAHRRRLSPRPSTTQASPHRRKRADDEIGYPIGQGSQGLLRSASLITAASASATGGAFSLARTVPSGVTSLAGGGVSEAGASGGIYVTVNVAGNVSTERDLGEAIYEFLVQKGIVNSSAGQLVAQA